VDIEDGNTMNVYISSHCRWAALHVKAVARAAGLAVASTWHDEPPHDPETLTDHEISDKLAVNYSHILSSDVLILVASPDKVPGGKFVEVGMAWALGKRIVVVGRRENLYMRYSAVKAFATPDEAIASLISQR
jgi:hypothetical protein